jgi:signal transduction histidine kinase
MQNSVFERFVQADTLITRPYEGAGLGLSISKAYAAMLGGKLWLDSIPGKGSEFYFTIPYDRSKS